MRQQKARRHAYQFPFRHGHLQKESLRLLRRTRLRFDALLRLRSANVRLRSANMRLRSAIVRLRSAVVRLRSAVVRLRSAIVLRRSTQEVQLGSADLAAFEDEQEKDKLLRRSVRHMHRMQYVQYMHNVQQLDV